MKRIRGFIIISAFILTNFWGCGGGGSSPGNSGGGVCNPTTTALSVNLAQLPKVKNVILFIGDGMGASHRLAAQYSIVGETGLLAMQDMPGRGSVCTGNVNNLITDSAAASTAMATGVKTDNGLVGISPSGQNLPTILEKAQSLGLATGLVTTTEITHATPAAFAAHVSDRNNLIEIAPQMIAKKVNVLLGGGEDAFYPTSVNGCYPQPGERNDGRNLVDEAMSAGYSHVCDASTLISLVPADTEFLLGLFADEKMVRPYAPDLATMTRKAIEILSQDPDGFFLMVEGGQIDTASHQNEAENIINDTIGLDDAIIVAREFLQTNNDTLIIVTADHETGGLDVHLDALGTSGEDGPFSMPDATRFYITWSTTGHTGQNVPLTAQGVAADIFSGTFENTFIFDVLNAVIK
jgi:alkaline phosphatase